MKCIEVSAFLFVLVAFQSEFKSCVARDTITYTTKLLDNGETLLSAGKSFELGFFNPEDDIHGGKYIGIWYYNLSSRTVVWVANRNAPLNIPGSFFISADGNLQLLDNDGAVYFHTNLTSSTAVNRTLMLQDSGNLALIDEQSGKPLWESFSDPTDTFLWGMKMDKNLKLVSWLDPGNPTNGYYTFQEDQQSNRLQVIKKGNILYWESKGSGSTELPIILTIFLSNNLTSVSKGRMVRNSTNANRSITYGTTPSSYDYNHSRLLMSYSGPIQFYTLENHQWSLKWSQDSQPNDNCSIGSPCGNFGMCNLINRESRCHCLPGFDPVARDNWMSGDFRSGCNRTSPICYETKQDKFLNLKSATEQEPDMKVPEIDSETCGKYCLKSCEAQCQAYYYDGQNSRNGSNYARPNCWIWTSTINDLRRNVEDGHDISIRVPASVIDFTSRDCKPCGEYIIPYPLSTGDCGDPLYNSFNCDFSTSQLFFLNNSHEVIDIKIKERRFVIQLNITADGNCDAGTSVLQLNQSLPFDVTNWCYSDPTNGPSTRGRQLVEIGWRTPPEPICSASSDCEDWPDSNCSEKLGTKRCFCNFDYRWDDRAFKCKQVTAANPKLSEAVIIVITVIAALLLAGGFSCLFYGRIIFKNKGSKESIPGNPLPYVYGNEGEAEDWVDEGDNVVDLPYFSLESILAATGNFADVNKLGQGGFGPVYKGTFPGGKEMAIKRLLSYSGQGREEFRNEVVLIAKLQHRNLVRLLGYCTKGSEKLLLYEYMPNRSLDTFIFDQRRCILLDWNTRFNIIMGFARGLLYLHQDSRLRIIHRDLKTSNILLDEDMNPKISDFGLARKFAGKEMEANTMRVVGTYGYMSPEYAQAGLYSVKSDVFSFGVILLEIVSGQRNTRFYHSGEALSLLGYAWRLWEARNAINLFDSRILESFNGADVLKCINIGLLCVQEAPGDRPTMSNVLIMLTSEVTTLPSPKEPGFISGKYASSMSASSSSHQAETISENKMSITFPEGR